MERTDIADLIYDDRADEKMWDHGVAAEQLSEILWNNDYVVVRNRGGRTADHILYGRDLRGRCLAVPIIPTDTPNVWRAITAWHCKPSEVTILNRKR